MEKLNEFLKRYQKEITFFLLNTILAFSSILLINTFNLLEFEIIPSGTLLYTTIILLLTLLFLKNEYSKKTLAYKNTAKIFFVLSLLAQLIVTNYSYLSTSILHSPISTIIHYPDIVTFLFFSSTIFLIVIHREEVRNLKNDLNISNKLSYFLLFLILVGFTVIKGGYFEYDFTGAATMKYNTYVEPAMYMVERGDFLWYQQKYIANPISNPEGISSSLPQLPLLEWTLATTYSVFPNNTIEFNTRLVMHTVGLGILVLLFFLTKEYSNNAFAIILTTIMATNQIIAYSTFVTVYDSIIFLLLLGSLLLLSKHLRKKKHFFSIFIGGVLIGLGASMKISLLILAIHAIALTVFLNKGDIVKKIFYFISFFVFSSILYVTTKYSIPTMPSNLHRSILIFLLGIVVVIATYLLLLKYQEKILKILEWFRKKRILIPTLLLSLAVVTYLGLTFVIGTSLVNHFLTDSRLIFNYPMYRFMVNNQFAHYISRNIFHLSMPGFLSLLVIKRKDIRNINWIMLGTSLFFWIIASKSIFIHDYYTPPIMYSLALAATSLVYFTFLIFKKNTLTLLCILALFGLFTLPNALHLTHQHLSAQRKGFREAAEYLRKNTQPEDIYIDEGLLLSLTIETGRARVRNINVFFNEEFREEVQELGFKGAMDKYNVKYLITSEITPSYKDYVYIFDEEKLWPEYTRREEVIFSIIGEEQYYDFKENDVRGMLVERYGIRDRFVFEKEIGVYRFFRFGDTYEQ